MAFRDAFIGNDGDEQGLGSKGWLFFAKDTGDVYYHDGSSWQTLPIGGNLKDTNDDGLLEAPNHDGIRVGTVETDKIHLGADTDDDGNSWRFDTDLTDTARIYSWDGSTATEYLKLNEGGPVEIRNTALDLNTEDIVGFERLKHAGSGSWGVIETSGDGTHGYRVHDAANSQDLMTWNEGGPVEVKNSVLSLASERSSAPDSPSSGAKLWVDSDGNLKATFANDTTKTITSN